MNLSTREIQEKYIFRQTDRHQGRHLFVSPSNSSMKHLSYGRIILDPQVSKIDFQTNDSEVGLICLSGRCLIAVDDELNVLTQFDSIYIPRDAKVRISTEDSVDLVECSARVTNKYPLKVVRFEDIKDDQSLRFQTGGDANKRTVNITLGKNVKAGRILAGFTISDPGHWTSFPPHEHAEILEELYVYFDMPAPAFGIQLVYSNPEEPEFVGIVREGDAVVMPKGFHPNVSIPGHPINFVWMMAAHREVEDRQFGVVNVQAGFEQNGSGLEASLKK